MPEKKKEKKKSSQGLADKIEIIYEILSAHEIGLKELESKVEGMSSNIKRVKGRMGLWVLIRTELGSIRL